MNPWQIRASTGHVGFPSPVQCPCEGDGQSSSWIAPGGAELLKMSSDLKGSFA